MKTRNVVIIAVSVILSMTLLALACTSLGPVVVGSSQLETREFDIRDFTSVEAGNACKVDVRQSDSYRVTITANQNLFDYLTLVNDGGTLKIDLKSFRAYNFITLEARITMPGLRGLQLSGASQGDIAGFASANPLNVGLSGASKLNINNVQAGDSHFELSGASDMNGSIKTAGADFNISGASKVELTGSASAVDVQASGASTVRLADFPTAKAKFNLSGASNGTANVGDTLDVVLSGASRLVYEGNPRLGSISVSGASTLNHQQ